MYIQVINCCDELTGITSLALVALDVPACAPSPFANKIRSEKKLNRRTSMARSDAVKRELDGASL